MISSISIGRPEINTLINGMVLSAPFMISITLASKFEN
jgi:hypothetical protein